MNLFLKLVFIIIWLTFFIILFLDTTLQQILFNFCVEYPIIAPFILIVGQLVFASLILPCSVLTLLAGMLWGVKIGLIYSTLATVIASTWTFILGRYLLKEKIINRLDWYSIVFHLIDKYKWKASMIAHINPLLPGASLGYVFGLSNVSISSFLLGALLGTLPLQLIILTLGFYIYN